MEKRTHVSPDFKVSERIAELAKEHGWPNPTMECEQFVDYHLAHGTLMLDWEAAFRTWLRNAKKFAEDKAARVYTQDKPMVRSYYDRQTAAKLGSPNIAPAPAFGERMDDNKITEGLEILRNLTKKLSVGGKP